MKTATYEAETATTTDSRQGGTKSGANKPGGSKPEQNQDAMKKAQAAGTPGAAHKALDAFAGDWEAEVKCWMEPGAPANVTHATSKAKLIFGGRFLEEEFHGEMMGKPFTGRLLLGFDNTKQKFNCVWLDDVSTAMMTSQGKGENGNKVITLEGKMDCPASGQKDVPVKQVLRVLSPDQHVWEMYNDGKKSMEITYNRQ